ncbi:MAG TPA: ABC transporter ATP-binding protein [Flavobacteriales bacterium]|jgi:lipoprotein-releasing system ATP-binding protein|nr:ABC transporter ATP-binding protein [Flavobacteriales bacterium]
MNAISAQHIIKYFHDPITFQVLKDISFDVEKGSFVSLVGKSGCGKSTLLYVLSTMDTDYEGKLVLGNQQVTGLSQDELARFRNKNLGFVFQFHFLLPEFSALENVSLPALKLGEYSEEEIEHRAMEKLRLVGMADYAKNPASKLSGGQQQRVAIARALINDPAVIMGDEPTGNLDKTNSLIVLDILKKLASENGQTIITVTHDHEFAQQTDRIIEMEDGLILKS